MIKLSDRLQLIANRINEKETMADIGTDHGFLPIYLKLSGISPKVVMCDVSIPSLQKAKDNADLYAASENGMYFRAGDGLQVLENGEVNTVVIAGMGGKLIRDIMAHDLDHTRSFKKFILQPRIGQGHLRKWLIENGFRIVSEDVVIEGDYIPEIITAISPGNIVENDMTCVISDVFDGDSLIWKIPPWIIDAGGPVGDFLNRSISLHEEKLNNVMKAKKRNMVLEESIVKDIEYLKKLRKEWEDGKYIR